MIRWVLVPGDFLCDGKNKFEKEIEEYSIDNGQTWMSVYPTTFRSGNLIEQNSVVCNYKWEGHYVDNRGNCPKRYAWIEGVGCVYVDPIKFVRCATSSSTTLTEGEIQYYPYELDNGYIGDCVTKIDAHAFEDDGVTGNHTILRLNSETDCEFNIPSGITEIGEYAFYGCNGIRTLNIPDSVTTIGNNVFMDCKNIRICTIGSGLTGVSNSAFTYCKAMTDCTFSQNSQLSTIGERAFYECKYLSYINLPDSVRTIGTAAFAYCSGLTNIYLTDLITSIGDFAFENCSGLTSIHIPSGLTSINHGTFKDCRNVTGNVRIPNGVTSINYYAFSNCRGVTSFEIGTGVTTIQDFAFQDCRSLSSITINATTPPTLGVSAFSRTNDCSIYVPCDSYYDYLAASDWVSLRSRIRPIQPCQLPVKFKATYIDLSTYTRDCDGQSSLGYLETKPSGYEYSAMTTAQIGEGCDLGDIGNDAFSGCVSLSSVTFLTNTINSIGVSAFKDCSSLSNFSIPSGATFIGNSAFMNCSSLSSVVIPSGVTNINSYAFKDCTGLTSITVNAITPPTLGSSGEVFDNTNNCPIYVPCESLNTYKTTSGWTSYASRIFGNGTCDYKLTATYIGGSSYSLECDLTSVLTSGETRPSGYQYTAMTDATIGDCITEIKKGAFSGFTSLSSVTIPNSVTNIVERAFQNCINLTGITIPSGVTVIDAGVFVNCSGFTSINIPSGVTNINSMAFYGCRSLTSVTIPSGVTNIQNYAFQYCTSLASITLESTTPPTIGISGVFNDTNNCPIIVPCGYGNTYKNASNWSNYARRIVEDCPKKVTLTYSGGSVSDIVCDSTSSITYSDVADRTNVIGAVIGDCTTTIDQYAFFQCSNLTGITITSNITSIGDSAFQYCTGLNGITVESATPPTLGRWVFDDTNYCNIYVPANSVNTYKNASGWSTYSSRIVGF